MQAVPTGPGMTGCGTASRPRTGLVADAVADELSDKVPDDRADTPAPTGANTAGGASGGAPGNTTDDGAGGAVGDVSGDAREPAYRLAGAAPATEAEREVVAAQLGRPPRAMIGVAHRCPCGLPDVVATAPRLSDGTPFPTFYYLTCPRATSAVGRV